MAGITGNDEVYDEGSYLGDVLDPANAASFVPFAPALNADDAKRLQGIARSLVQCETSSDRVRLVRRALHATDGRAWKLKAALSVLLDLMRHEYCVKVENDTLLVSATTLDSWQGSPGEYKQFQRRHLLQERDLQLAEDSVRRFIHRMETPRLFENAQVSVNDLIADGRSIMRRLRTLQPSDEFSSLAIQPYVQEVELGARDEFTGLALQDVWRYFRHTWTLPYNSTPGRNMQFLIRDSAQPNHPIMGILGLGSSVIQITPRDDELGWTVDAVLERFAALLGLPSAASESKPDGPTAADAGKLLAAMRRSLKRARSEVSHVDLCHHKARASPELLERLRLLAIDLSDKDYAEGTNREQRTFREERDTPLFKKKRAKSLYRILRAQLYFDQLSGSGVGQLRQLVTTRDGRAALSVALQEQKKRHVGSSIIDLVVCGAVAPYSSLLGGKLVAMLATSPTVIECYRRRYADAASHIASAMKGGAVTRPARIVFVGTTSLYETHSSQYERIRLPDDLGGLRYQLIGKTEGFASVQFSPETRDLLERATVRVRGRRFVTHKFGEGVNPKLRGIAMGLSDLGLDGRLLKYSSRRLVYGSLLATNARDYLLGVDPKPHYYWDGRSSMEIENAIARFWLERWAAPRARRDDVAQALEGSARERIRSALRPHRSEVSLEIFVEREPLEAPPHLAVH